MAANQGTLVIAPIRPNDSLDSYPTAHANEILGGLHAVATLVDRDAIPADRRLAGMLCNVSADNTLYQLLSDLTTWAKIVPPQVECQTGRIDAIDTVPHHLISKAREARTITGIRVYLNSGSCTVAVKIAGTAVAGAAALAVTDTPQEVFPVSSNAVAVGNSVSLEISNAAQANNLYFQIDYRITA